MEKIEKEKERARQLIIEKIAQESQLVLPEILIEAELEKMVDDFKRNTEEALLKFDEYLSQIGKTKEELKKDWRSSAENRVLCALCLREIGKVENIKVTEEEIKNEVNKYLSRLEKINQPKDVDPKTLKSYCEDVIRNEKIFKLLENYESHSNRY